jgi:hypothetical protein
MEDVGPRFLDNVSIRCFCGWRLWLLLAVAVI